MLGAEILVAIGAICVIAVVVGAPVVALGIGVVEMGKAGWAALRRWRARP